MRTMLTLAVDGGRTARVVHTTRADGDLSPGNVDLAMLQQRRHAITGDLPWHPLRQVHGRDVQLVTAQPTGDTTGAPPEADAAVTIDTGQVVVVHTGDCVPVGFVHPAGAVAVAHAGWKGLEAGVLESTLDALVTMVGDDERPPVAVVGPHIRVGSYEFGHDELTRLSSVFGPHVRGATSTGGPALDLTATTVGELNRLGAQVAAVSPDCTARSADLYWSHRARAESGRLALAAWIEPS